MGTVYVERGPLAVAAASRVIRSIDPATLEPLGEVEAWDAARVEAAVSRARAAFPRWRDASFAERGRLLAAAKRIILQEADSIAELISRECGKTVASAVIGEVFPVVTQIDYFVENAERFLRPERVDIRHWSLLGRRSHLEAHPIGVVGVISPWNFPFTLSLGPSVMGLVAGNCVILKPSEVTPLVGQKIAEIFRRAGLPDGVFEVAQGDGQIGAAVVRNVDKVFFIGSERTGRKILAEAANRLTPAVLELGGSAPAIVLEDADLPRAAGIAWASFFNAGQFCGSIQRLYVARAIEGPFMARLLEEVGRLRQGPDRRAVDLGSLTCEMQLRVVEEMVEDAKRQGARVLCGGRRRPDLPGLFYEPTILTDVPQRARIMTEEVFGPVVVEAAFDSEKEAVDRANDSRYGLTASVWTRDLRRGARLASRIEAGTVTVNDHGTTAGMGEVPWGGVKQSGFGSIYGREGLLEFVQRRHVHVNRFAGMRQPWWYPETPQTAEGMLDLARSIAGEGVLARARSGLRALRSLLPGAI